MERECRIKKTIAFVIPWYGENIPGGAEACVRGVAHHLNEAGVPVEILSTRIREFTADWSRNEMPEGAASEAGLTVRRFPAEKRDSAAFDAINLRLMRGRRIKPADQKIFLEEMIRTPSLYEYISAHRDDYGLFVFIPYMFSTTYYGILACPEKAVMIPCFHEEGYIHIAEYKKAFEKVRGMAFLAEPERSLANRAFNLDGADGKEAVQQATIGVGVDNDISGDGDRFKDKYGIKEPFLLYAGRKDEGKNIGLLLKYFSEFKRRHDDNDAIGALKLVLIGGGTVDIPTEIENDVVDLGFVDKQDKYDAYAAALALCQPSVHESFSIVIMESWLCKRPVIVHNGCDVTREFVRSAQGGLYFDNYFEFEGCVEYLFENGEIADALGKNGCDYVNKNFTWDIVTKRYMEFFSRLCE